MAKQLSGNDIIQDGHLQNAIKEAELLKKAYDDLDASIVKLNKDLAAQTKGNRGQTASEIQTLNTALQKTRTIKESALKVEQDKIKLDERLSSLRSQEIQENERLKVQITAQRKANRDLAKEQLGLNNSYDKLVQKTNAAQNNFKRLAAQFGVNSSQAKKARAEFDKVEKELRQINTAAKDGRRDVGRYGTALQGAAGGAKRLLGALGVVGGIQLFVRGIKDAFNVVKNFDQASANLASVLGINRDAMGALTEQAKQLGATTKFTASNVAELQLEFAKLGFTQKEIENVTEATLELAAASGTDLGNAAEIAGSTLRAFGLDTSETQRVVDVMAKSFSASSLDIDKFKAAMSSVAPVAKGAGFTIEQTTALLGTLTNAGIDASTAGTGLRNIFLELTKKGLTFEESMNKIATSTDKNATSLALFGKRGAALGTILAENQDGFKGLTKTLEGSAGAAGEMADKQLDTLAGSLDILRSAWEGAILEMNDASGATDGLKDLVLLLAEALPHLIRGISQAAGNLASFIKTIVGLKEAWTNAFDSQQNFANAIADTADSLLGMIPGFKQLTNLLRDNKTVLIDLTEEQKRNNAVNENALKIGRDLLAQNKDELGDIPILIDALTDENTTREEKNKIIAKLNKDYPEQLKNINLETASTEALIAVKKELIKTMLTQAVEERKAEERAKVFSAVLDLQISKIGITSETRQAELDRRIQEQLAGLQMIDDVAAKVLGEMGESIDSMDLKSPIEGVSSEVTKLTAQISEIKSQLEGLEPGSEEAQRLQKALNKKLSLLATYEKQRVDLIKDGLDEEGNVTGGVSGPSGGGSGGAKKAVDQEKIKNDKLLALKKAHNLKLLQLEADFITMGIDQEVIDEELFKIQVAQKREQGDLIKELDFEDTEVLKKHRLDYLKFVEKGEVDRVDLHKQSAIEIDDINETLADKDKGRDEAALKRKEENFKALQKAANETAKFIETLINSEIAEIDNALERSKQEISASENEINRLQSLAAQGNNDAVESIKAERIAQAKEKANIEALEKKKKNLLITISALNQANQFFQSGDLQGYQKASANVNSFLSSLPKFWEGTETTVADALGNPHLNTKRDAYIARLDGSEGVLTGDKMDSLRNVGLRTTTDITNAAIKAQTMGMSLKALNANRPSGYENIGAVNALGQRIEKAINGIEIINNHFDFDKLVETVQKGNTTNRNHYSKDDNTFKV